jgi:DNA (cytosine-5)-methyltransferase 1
VKRPSIISAVDLFCGAGGLTFGLERSGIKVRLGIDIDPKCAHPIEANSKAKFLHADVSKLDVNKLLKAYPLKEYKLLAGCAPCQPFSTYSRSAKDKHGGDSKKGRNEDWKLVEYFGNIIQESQPDLVTMENVPPMIQNKVFIDFLEKLYGYWSDWKIVECQTVGLPQSRKRLVFLASKLGPINIPVFKFPQTNVRSTIGNLPPIAAGEQDPDDRLHKACRLSPRNLERIQCSVPGGTWRDWPERLRATCHSRKSGATYPSVYGRMIWDAPSPTITTQCFGYGNGRFGHPDQDRAISLREAAMLQGFPKNYSFAPEDSPVSFSKIGQLIGNAVPVTLGTAIGAILQDHVRQSKI